MKFLVVGLGNIGGEYAFTRHNVGFMALDYFVDGFDKGFESNRYGETIEFTSKGKRITFLKPSTYMNLSGKAVRYWKEKLKISEDRILVLTDDVAIPFGKLRLKPKGSAGGHNGLKNIEELLGTSAYPRLRIGVGGDYPKGAQVKYVLGNFTDSEMEVLKSDLLGKVSKAIESFVLQGIDSTMNQFNG